MTTRTWGELMEILKAANAPQGSLQVVGFHGPTLYLNGPVVERFLKDVELKACMEEPLTAGESIAMSLLMQNAGL